MSKDEFNFQRDLKKVVFESDPTKMDRNELVTLVFKSWAAKLFEYIKTNEGLKDGLEVESIVNVKRKIINEFRRADLGEYQKSEKQYDELFEETIREMLELAAQRHQGQDITTVEQSLSINPDKYIKEGGLFVPDHLKS